MKRTDGGITAARSWVYGAVNRGGKAYAKKLKAKMIEHSGLEKVVSATAVAKLGQINPPCLIFRTIFLMDTANPDDASDEMNRDSFAAFSSGW